MALIYSGIRCAICNQLISDELLDKDEFVAATHFIADPCHSLWRFSDAAMHQACFMDWVHRQEFVRLYNETIGRVVWGNGTHHHMNNDGRVISVKE